MPDSVTFRPNAPTRRFAGLGLLSVVAPAGLAALVLGPVAATHAADFCVACQGPEAHYVCAFDDVAAGSQDPRLKLLCITSLAGQGGHASCSVERVQVAPCKGERKVLPTPEGLSSTAPGDATAPAGIPAPPDGAAGDEALDKAPASNTAEGVTPGATAKPEPPGTPTGAGETKSGKAEQGALEKASDAVGHAAKKTWDCITTLFGSC